MRILAALLLSTFALTACTAPGSQEPPAKTRKKKKKKKRAAPPAAEVRAADSGPKVQFTVRNAGLRADVLPKFLEQAGVKIHWTGPERKVSLRLTRPTPWRDALDLICQFTRTHPTRDYQGRIVLKEGWGGTLGGDEDIDALTGKKKTDSSQGTGSRSTGVSGGSGASGSSSSSGQGETKVEYNSGTKPGKPMWDKVGG